jgi:hypothetical protein
MSTVNNIEGLILTEKSIDQLKFIQEKETNDIILRHSISLNTYLVNQLNFDSEENKPFINWLQSLNTLIELVQSIKS